jgi:hypothetical protein
LVALEDPEEDEDTPGGAREDMHIDENLTAYLEYYFLDQRCDQVS